MKPGDDEYLTKYSHKYHLGYLFYTHIRGTELEAAGWTAIKLAQYLETAGMVLIVRCSNGDLQHPGVKVEVSKFVWRPGKQIKREELVKHIMKRSAA